MAGDARDEDFIISLGKCIVLCYANNFCCLPLTLTIQFFERFDTKPTDESLLPL